MAYSSVRIRLATTFIMLVGLAAHAAPALAAAAARSPREDQSNCPAYPCKAAGNRAGPFSAATHIEVRFNTGLMVRERNAQLSDLGSGDLMAPDAQAVLTKYALAGCTWMRVHNGVPEATLDQMHLTAEQNLAKPVANLNQAFFLYFPNPLDAAGINAAIDDFNALAIVEMAEPALIAEQPPLSVSYRAEQQYLYPTTQGVNAFGVRLFPGGFGQGVRVADLEYSWNLSHQDLPPITTLGGANAVDPFASTNHGTAVIGQLFARDNGFGITGAVPSCIPYVAPVNFTTGYNPAAAISTTTAAFGPADVIVIEQQLSGPNRTNPNSDVGYIPVEWNRGIYNAVVTAIGNGVHVVEAAGNGFQNLDAAVYGTGNGGHFPFQAANDSGSIIVGAGGAAVNGSVTPRSRLDFSNYGSRVNLQGWGESVVTLGYGGRYNAEGMNLWYTSTFNGTSSATPIVAGAVAVYHSVLRAYNGATPTPSFTRSFLISFGAPQTSGAFPSSQKIGPLPDVLATLNGTILFAPANNACASATVLAAPGYGYTTGRLSGATLDGSATCTGSTTNVADVWFRYTAQSYPGILWLSTCGTNDAGEVDTGIDTVMSVFTSCGGTELGCNDDDLANPTGCGSNTGLNRDSALALPLSAGQSVVIRVANYASTPKGAFAMNWLFIPANDLCSTAIDISTIGPTATTFTGSLINARATGTSSCGTAAGNGAIWYTHTACSAGTLTITTCGTHDFGGTDAGIDTVLTAFAGCSGAEIACNDDSPSASICSTLDQGSRRDSYLSIPVTAGQQVVLRVSRFSSSPLASGTVRVNASFSVANDCLFSPIAAITGTNPFCNRGTPSTYFGLTEAVCAPANPNLFNAAWFRWVAPATGAAVFDTCGSAFDTKIAIYQGGCPIFSNQAIACNDDAPGCPSSNLASRIALNVTGGTAYFIRAGAFSTFGFGNATLNIALTPDSAACCIGAVCSLVPQSDCVAPAGSSAGAFWSGAAACNASGDVQTPCCYADFNKDTTRTVTDIFAFLSAWFTQSPYATVGGDGVQAPAVTDIFLFLSAWFAGC